MVDVLVFGPHPDDIEMPKGIDATISDVDWLEGEWFGTRGSSTIDERWTPPKGGAMLGTNRTVKGDRMSAFEFLRIVEKGDGLVYVAQPGGGTATEFVLVEKDPTRVKFVNPKHDYPQRIVYEFNDEGDLTANIGFAKGGRGITFVFGDEGD